MHIHHKKQQQQILSVNGMYDVIYLMSISNSIKFLYLNPNYIVFNSSKKQKLQFCLMNVVFFPKDTKT